MQYKGFYGVAGGSISIFWEYLFSTKHVAIAFTPCMLPVKPNNSSVLNLIFIFYFKTLQLFDKLS